MGKLLKAGFTFTGTIIGAGILGLPYIISKPGFFLGLLAIILIGTIVLLISLMLGEICLRTKEDHQIPGLVEKYIGKKTKYLVTFFSMASMYGALLAYVEGNGKLISNFLGIEIIIAKLIFFIPFATIIYFGIKGVEESETILTLFVIVSILILSFASLLYFNPKNLISIRLEEFFTPFGIIVFAFSGIFAIPQMKEILRFEKYKLKESILFGFLVPLVIYILFTFSTIAAFGNNIGEIATISLARYGIFFLLFGNIFAFFAMATCFISLGNALREIYLEDFKIDNNLSFLFAVLPPLLSLFGFATFTQILSMTGSLFIIPLMLIIIYLYYKTKKIYERRPEYELKIPNFIILLISIFLLFVTILTCLQILLF